MTSKPTEPRQQGNVEKDPDEWISGQEPMTGAQRAYLKTLSDEAHAPFDDGLTKAEASKRIDELRKVTGKADADRNRPAAQRAS